MRLDISFISSNEIMILLRGGTEKCLAYIHSNKKRIFLQVLYDVLFATEVTCAIRFRIPRRFRYFPKCWRNLGWCTDRSVPWCVRERNIISVLIDNTIYALSPALARQYLQIVWMDTVCYNMDRHTENFGFLRDVQSGEIVSMAPNYDNNIALISRGYLNSASRDGDGIIRFFREFLQENPTAKEMLREMELPVITESLVTECLKEIPIAIDSDYIVSFNSQVILYSINDFQKSNKNK